MDGSLEITGSAADDILKEARLRFKLAMEAESDNRTAALDDLNFLNGEMWTKEAKDARKDRPCLSIDRLSAFVRQVVNEQRKTRPAIDIIPADTKASKPTADVFQGLVRRIERDGKAQIAKDTAFEYAVACGIGHFRICTEYASDDGLEQEIKMERIENPFTVYSDPGNDWNDGEWKFVSDLVDKDEFKAEYGFEPSTFEECGKGDDVAPWFDNEKVRRAEYWRVVRVKGELNALPDGTIIKGPVPAELKALYKDKIKTRQTSTPRVEQYLLTYDRVIKKSEWKGKYIPIVTSVGGERNINGVRVLTSLVRPAKDSARMYNYWASAETEAVALQPKAPWVVEEDQLDGDQRAAFARANMEATPFLTYTHKEGAPPPQRQMPPAFPQGIREGRMAAAEDIKAVLGMYDASLGARSNETSGVALRARQQEGDTGTFHFIDNHARAIEQAGRIIVDLAPHVYDTARVIRILGPTDEETTAAINQTFIDPVTGKEQMHDMSAGRYDVAVRVGPSFESQRQEMVAAVIQLADKYPPLMELAGDVIVKNMDWPQSQEIAKRIEAKMQQGPPQPPELQVAQMKIQAEAQKFQAESAREDKQGAMKAQQAQMDAQLKHEQQQNDLMLQQSNDQREAEIDRRKHDLAMELARVQAEIDRDTQVQIANIRAAADVMKAQIAAGQADGAALLKQEAEAAGYDAMDGIAKALTALSAPKRAVKNPDGSWVTMPVEQGAVQ